jgi:hypothetical protein
LRSPLMKERTEVGQKKKNKEFNYVVFLSFESQALLVYASSL